MQYPSDMSISHSICDKMKEKAYVISTPLSIKEAIGVASTIDEARKIATQNLNAPLDADVKVEIQINYFDAPKENGIFVGEDLLLKYYSQNNGVLCVGKGGWKGNLSITACDLDFHHLICYLNPEVFSKNAYSIGNIIHTGDGNIYFFGF